MEHAVLDFRIARREALISGNDAAALADRLDIPAEIAAWAIEVNKEPAKYEAIKDTPLETQAAAVNESLRGSGAVRRKEILDRRTAADAALTAAKEVAARESAGPDAVEALDKAQRIYDDAYQDYADLPDEVLAWDAGQQVQIAVRMHDNLLSQMDSAGAVIARHEAALKAAMQQSGADAAIGKLRQSVESARQKLDELVAILAARTKKPAD
jgi:hypothetical protein